MPLEPRLVLMGDMSEVGAMVLMHCRMKPKSVFQKFQQTKHSNLMQSSCFFRNSQSLLILLRNPVDIIQSVRASLLPLFQPQQAWKSHESYAVKLIRYHQGYPGVD